MSIVSFWSDGKEQTGKTLSVVAIATSMAIERNMRILIISTGHMDYTLDNCFWEKIEPQKKNLGLFGPNTNTVIEEGISGLEKIMRSNKLLPETITNYTKIIFKDRLEILQCYKGNQNDYNEIKKSYVDIINIANKYYDLVLVDLDKKLEDYIVKPILNISNLVIANLSQRLSSINSFLKIREQETILKSSKTLILIGRYDKFSKYSIKNISRYMGEKNKVCTVPYNTLFFEAAEEAGVPDLFLKLRRIDEEDRNGFFVAEIKRISDNIIYRLQDLNMRT